MKMGATTFLRCNYLTNGQIWVIARQSSVQRSQSGSFSSDKKWNFLQKFPAASIAPRSLPQMFQFIFVFSGRKEFIIIIIRGPSMCMQRLWMTMPSSLYTLFPEPNRQKFLLIFLWRLFFFWPPGKFLSFPFSRPLFLLTCVGNVWCYYWRREAARGTPACCRKNQ